MDWLNLLAVQGTLKTFLQYHSSKVSTLWLSAFFIVQLSHPCMTTGKTIALTRWTFVSKVMSLLFNMLSSLVIVLPRSKHRLISWLQSPSAVILEQGSLRMMGDGFKGRTKCHWLGSKIGCFCGATMQVVLSTGSNGCSKFWCGIVSAKV